jgi:cyanoexosortase B
MQITRRASLIQRYWSEAVLFGLLILMYAPLLLHWYQGWLRKSISIEHEYFSHGLIGLPFAALIVWNNRHHWQRLGDNAHPLTLLLSGGLVLVGGSCYLTGLPDLVNLSFPVLLAATCLWLKGLPGLRLQGFALLLVFLATPNEIPYLIAPYTLPLQSFISHTAGFLLNQLGMNVQVNSIYLQVNGRTVEVAPYCAGLKMLFTSLYVSLMLLYWAKTLRFRNFAIALLLGTIALSVTANIIRNTLLTFFHGTGQEGLFQWLHEGWGGDLYSTGMLGLILLLHNQMEKSLLSPSAKA